MTECSFCDGPRLNGTVLRDSEDGWREAINKNPVAPDVYFACRSCAREKLGPENNHV